MKTYRLILIAIISLSYLLSCGTDDTIDPPNITIQPLTVTIDENPSDGDVLGTVVASTDRGTILYSITSQLPQGAISINEITGQLSVANAAAFDFEINPTITAGIRATVEDFGASASATITLNNLAESVNTEPFATTIDENPEGNTSLGSVSATTDFGSINYSLVSQTPNNALNINTTTGELTVADASLFDFEANSTINATYEATNGAITQQNMIVITLNDIDEVDANAFIFTVVTTTPNETLFINYHRNTTNSTPMDYTIDWAGEEVDVVKRFTDNRTHTFATPGTYTITISGMLPGINFWRDIYTGKTITIEQWGNIKWATMENMFTSVGNVTINAQDVPDLSEATSLTAMFSGVNIVGTISNLEQWDVSNIEQFFGVFSRSNFNQSINSWDMRSAVTISQMFFENTAFNQPVNDWDLSSCTNLLGTFDGATAFNQPLDQWDVSKVTEMSEAFERASSFDQNLGNWDLRALTRADKMFSSVGLSVDNYDNTLIGWANNANTASGITLGADALKYSATGETARNTLINDKGWTINGDSRQ